MVNIYKILTAKLKELLLFIILIVFSFVCFYVFQMVNLGAQQDISVSLPHIQAKFSYYVAPEELNIEEALSAGIKFKKANASDIPFSLESEF